MNRCCLFCCFEFLEIFQGTGMTHSYVSYFPQRFFSAFSSSAQFLYTIFLLVSPQNYASLKIPFYFFFLLLPSPSTFPELLWFLSICNYCFCHFLEAGGNTCKSSVCYLKQVGKDVDSVQLDRIRQKRKRKSWIPVVLHLGHRGRTEYSVRGRELNQTLTP